MSPIDIYLSFIKTRWTSMHGYIYIGKHICVCEAVWAVNARRHNITFLGRCEFRRKSHLWGPLIAKWFGAFSKCIWASCEPDLVKPSAAFHIPRTFTRNIKWNKSVRDGVVLCFMGTNKMHGTSRSAEWHTNRVRARGAWLMPPQANRADLRAKCYACNRATCTVCKSP